MYHRVAPTYGVTESLGKEHVMRRNLFSAHSFGFAMLLFYGTTGLAGGPEEPSKSFTLGMAEQEAEASLKKLVDRERQFLEACGTKTAFRSFATEMVGTAEKLQQILDLAHGYDGAFVRVQSLFEKHVVSQKLVQKRMHNAFNELQEQLVKDSVTLFLQYRVPASAMEKVKLWKLRPAAFSVGYSPLFEYGVSLAHKDWFRAGSGVLAAGAVSGIAESAAREVGLWNHDEGGWMDALLGAAVEAIAHQVIEEASDPTPKLAGLLKSAFDEITDAHMTVQNGFADTLRQLTKYHIDAREKLIRVAKEGAK